MIDTPFQELRATQTLRGPGLPQRFHVAFDLPQPHPVQDAARVQVFLREEADVLDAGLARRLFHGGCEGGAIVLFQ